MAGLKRTRDRIDILEHAMRGVQTSENRGRMVRFHQERGVVGLSSESAARTLDDAEVEREVIVRMPRAPTTRRSR